MEGEIILGKDAEELLSGDTFQPLGRLEEAISHLLIRYHEVLKERETLAHTLGMERERVERLEKKLELLSIDREKIKMRIDQLLLQLKILDG